MIKIRLQRRGRKKRPIHHIVVADSRAPRDGRIVEDLGRFDNVTPKNDVKLNEERAIYWLKQGAQPSDTVRSILKNKGIMYKMHLMRWGKSDEEIDTALTKWREAREAKVEKEPSKKKKQQAMLDAEEKEYQKQLKKKAEEAAKEKAKQEALAKAKAEEEAKAAEKTETDAEAKVEEAEETSEAENEPKAEESDDKTAKTKSEESAEEKTEVKAEESETDKAEDSKPEEASADKEEVKADKNEESPEKEEDSEGQTSDDMLAKDAIEHIENTPLNDLKGFVTDDEDRVTVQRAWEEKQEE